ncbi:Src homology-3 [Rhizopus microsporus]|uniref:Src homology-3 n=1 Tax=Rhizopus microsporus TaxID=58291 RepID=A0A1X0RN76_RHIZD|nr:Src homology-3 [Rhizopus microsporus]
MNTKDIICQVRALYPYEPKDPSALSFKANAIIDVFAQLESGWWDGCCEGRRGWFPSNYVEILKQAVL